MARRVKPLPVLEGDQAAAVDPAINAALSASAGTGKTQVLTGRVLRLLLSGAAPETILCVTFTKAGAAEMANRIGQRLASWVRMPEPQLKKDLFALGVRDSPSTLQLARRLFARVLDAPGGLRIQTIHGFAQTLLASFPAEAGITPGFQPIEGRAEQELARTTLANLMADAEASGSRQLLDDVQCLSLRLGEGGAVDYLMKCARAGDALGTLGEPAGIEARVRAMMNLPDGSVDEFLAHHCHDDRFDCDLLQAIADANRTWDTAEGRGHVERIERWLALPASERAAELPDLALLVFTKSNEPRKVRPGQVKVDPAYSAHVERLARSIADLLQVQRGAQLAREMAAGLRAGSAFATAYSAAKRSAGVADFNDLIAWTRRLLNQPGMGEWVRYKLDQRTDHILVDESQDTNRDQWEIIQALAGEYFSGLGASERRHRTMFMVGDFKQAIFRFQGTNPDEFRRAADWVRDQSEELREAVDAADDRSIPAPEFRNLSIDASFRSSQAVLDLVDAVIDEVGHRNMGVAEVPNRHRAHFAARPGLVELWPPFEAPEAEEDAGEEGWVDETDRLYAGALAKRIRRWLDEAPVLASTERPLSPGDILILVRSRGELASLIVARLFGEHVPVAGIDRLHLQEPLAVKDLLAAIAFAVQPLDDLNLANLLVSPLLGWNQQQLFDLAHGRAGPLWTALGVRAEERADFAEARTQLGALLAMADYTTPHQFLETLLTGPLEGRRKLYARLGSSARDPIDELLSSALEFERAETASLDRFLSWFSKGDVEIKRDPSAPANAVRVMTVHGAKGLEAPVVILADSTSNPDRLGGPSTSLQLDINGARVPMLKPRKAEAMPPFDVIMERDKMLDLEEHWRLLYVGLTRASERLIVAGVKPRGERSENSWHARVELALGAVGGGWEEQDDGGDAVLRYRGTVASRAAAKKAPRRQVLPLEVPAWVNAAAPPEARPPRPLAPSAIAEDREPAPAPSDAMRAAAKRGTLIHQLLERLAEVAPQDRRTAALRWLERGKDLETDGEFEAVADEVCRVLGNADYAPLFGPGSLAEAPLAATLPDGRVIAGTVDRLLVEEERVSVLDFKTGRVPVDSATIPTAHRLQMAAYSDALRVIFPGRTIRAALLYTGGPQLFDLTS